MKSKDKEYLNERIDALHEQIRNSIIVLSDLPSVDACRVTKSLQVLGLSFKHLKRAIGII